jgi:hypothetical protein
MGLGDKAAALTMAERAMTVNRIEQDALTGPTPIDIFARVAARMGEPRPRHCRFTEAALDTLR